MSDCSRNAFSVPYAPKSAVLSIKPKYAEAIFSGRKTVEYRKSSLRSGVDGIYIHVCGEDPACVQGFVSYSGYICGSPSDVWEKTKDTGCVTEEEFFDYFRGADTAYALQLEKATVFRNPLCLKKLGLTRPPQGIAYVKGVER